MSSDYYEMLDEKSKKRYKQKLTYEGETLPDPLDDHLREYLFRSKNMRAWPNIEIGDVFMYLVEKECSYTNEKFKNYQSLDSYNFYRSKKVHNILCYRCDELKICIVSCCIEASQTLKKIHKPWIVAKVDGPVISGHCTCMAGLGEVCSHVAAILFTVYETIQEEKRTPSCTSVSCIWNKTVKRVDPVPAVEINFLHKRIRINKQTKQKKKAVPASNKPTEEAYLEFLNTIRIHQPNAPIFTVLTDTDDTDTADEGEKQDSSDENKNGSTEKENDVLTNNIIEIFRQKNRYLPVNTCLSERVELLWKTANVDSNSRKKIEESTKLQRKSKEWFHQRKGRLTASLFGRILRCKTGHENVVAQIMGYNKEIMTTSMKWGCDNEASAKESFYSCVSDQHINFQMHETGLQLDENYGFLGASADGIVSCDCCENALLEIKCPARGRNKTIIDLVQLNNFFLDENLNLKISHNYYTQIQGQMGISKIGKCFFVTYTDIDIHIQVIDYDADYWNFQKSALISFFKQYVIPEILEEKIGKKKLRSI